MISEEIKKTLKTLGGDNWKKVILLGILILLSYTTLYWLPKDNPIEQAVEEVIELETGFRIDLTP